MGESKCLYGTIDYFHMVKAYFFPWMIRTLCYLFGSYCHLGFLQHFLEKVFMFFPSTANEKEFAASLASPFCYMEALPCLNLIPGLSTSQTMILAQPSGAQQTNILLVVLRIVH